MDCFQVTKLRRITKRRFNELAIQARERLPLDLIGHAPGGVQCHAHSSVLRTQRKRRHVPCRQGAVRGHIEIGIGRRFADPIFQVGPDDELLLGRRSRLWHQEPHD